MATEVSMTAAQFKAAWPRFVEGFAIGMVQALQRRCPVDKGRLRRGISYRVKGNVIELYMPFYGFYVDQGTAPHIIRPKNKKALKFSVGATGPRGGKTTETVIVKEVKHPGTRPQPFIRETFRIDAPRIAKEAAMRYLR